jgi:hypothetical protein
MFKKTIGVLGLVTTLSLGACIFAPGEIEPNVPACGAGEHVFNGECHPTCATSAQCTASNRCMYSEPDVAMCLPYGNCAHLGSDTQCVGVERYSAQTRGGMESLLYESYPVNANPYDTTPYEDPSFEASPYAEPYSSDFGCRGNARWVTDGAVTDPGCSQKHAVTRCRRVGKRCRLVSGETRDFVAP